MTRINFLLLFLMACSTVVFASNQCNMRKSLIRNSHLLTNSKKYSYSLSKQLKNQSKCHFQIPRYLAISSKNTDLCNLHRLTQLLNHFNEACFSHTSYTSIQQNIKDFQNTFTQFVTNAMRQTNCSCHHHRSDVSPFQSCGQNVFLHFDLMLTKHLQYLNHGSVRRHLRHLRACESSRN